MASPIPLPTNVKQLRGTAQPCRMNPCEPRPAKLKSPKPPSWLNKEEKKCWRDTVTKLQAMGVITTVDVNSIARYCRIFVNYEKESALLEAEGHLSTGCRKNTIRNPRVQVVNDYHRQALLMEREFGMTAASRSRIKAEVTEPEDQLEVMARRNREKRRMAREGV